MGSLAYRFVAAEAVWPLRRACLRPHQPPAASRYPFDADPACFHVAAVQDEAIVGVSTYFPETQPTIESRGAFRLRGMATHPDFRRRGIGSGMLRTAEARVFAEAEVLWCNARRSAYAFYERMGFSIASDEFEIDGIGPHRVMLKRAPRPRQKKRWGESHRRG
ncbi:MAG: GNAT family N-acetyltransferase [Myxococcota bacterium]